MVLALVHPLCADGCPQSLWNVRDWYGQGAVVDFYAWTGVGGFYVEKYLRPVSGVSGDILASLTYLYCFLMCSDQVYIAL